MDDKTREYLERAHREMPDSLKKKLFTKEKSMGDLKERLEAASKDPYFSERARAKAKAVNEFNEAQGAYREDIVVSEKGSKEVERWHEEYIKRGIESGKIKRPNPGQDDQLARLLKLSKKK